MSSVHAMEDALGVKITKPIRDLRRLLYCGEWIESHALHVYMLHAPDFLGYQGAIEMARDHGEIVKRGLDLKKTGNTVMSVIGGREIHPINVRVGGFYKAPRKRELAALSEALKRARDQALETVRWVAGFDYPDSHRDYEFVALTHPDEYALNEGRIVSNRGLNIGAAEYDQHFAESHVAHSNALQSRTRAGGTYLVGPLARSALNFQQFTPLAQDAAKEAGILPPAPIPTEASWCVRSSSFTPATKHSESSLATRSRTGPSSPLMPMPGLALQQPKRRAECSITAIVSPTMARSWKRRSCRLPHRIRRRSRRI